MNKGKYLSTWNKIALTCLNVIIVVIGAVIVSIPPGHRHPKSHAKLSQQCGLGLYASGKELHEGKGGQVFTCEDTAPQL